MSHKLTLFQWAIVSIFITTMLHLLVATQAGLSTDEAHYALYGLHLDWSYFDHPPLVGWLQSIVLLFSESDFSMRLVPAFLYSLTAIVLYQLTVELFPDYSPSLPLVTVLLYQSGFIFQLIGFALVPDTPLLLFGLLVVWSFNRLFSRSNPKYWLLIGLFMGLSALSKYTAITLVFSAAILLLTEIKTAWYKEPYFYIAIVLSLFLITPILYWNAINDWVSFNYQIAHGTGEKNWHLENWLITHIVQFLTFSPLIFIAGLMGLFHAFKHRQELSNKILIIFSLPILMLFSFNSGYVKSLPHWFSLFWLFSLPLGAIWLINVWHLARTRIFAYLSLSFSLLSIILVFSQLHTPWMPLSIEQNFARDLQQWNKLKPQIEKLQSQIPTHHTTLFVPNWTLGSRLAWYMKPSPVKVLDARYDQFDIWFGAAQQGESGLLVFPDYYLSEQELKQTVAKFEQCSQLDNKQQHELFSFTIYHCINFID